MEREPLILEHLEPNRASSYEELAKLFRVSVMTIRRDVDRLAQRGMAIKTLGGAQKAATETGNLHETALLSRLSKQRREKRAIARRALDLIEDGQTLFIDGGTTCLELAKLIAREKKGLTVITNSVMVCRDVGQNAENLVIGLGGQYDPVSLSFVGAASLEEAAKFFPDMAVFSTKGFIPGEGTYESFVPTLRIKQIIVRHCMRVVLLADHTKFGQRALRKVLDVSQIHDVITDAETPAAALASLKKRGTRVWITDADDLNKRPARRKRQGPSTPKSEASP
jgi:DeoR/GlpR family transcriptional regulator of sugar metabolism